MFSRNLVIASASFHSVPRDVVLDGVTVQGLFTALILELVDPETDESRYERIISPSDEQIAAFTEGATVTATIAPTE